MLTSRTLAPLLLLLIFFLIQRGERMVGQAFLLAAPSPPGGGPFVLRTTLSGFTALPSMNAGRRQGLQPLVNPIYYSHHHAGGPRSTHSRRRTASHQAVAASSPPLLGRGSLAHSTWEAAKGVAPFLSLGALLTYWGQTTVTWGDPILARITWSAAVSLLGSFIAPAAAPAIACGSYLGMCSNTVSPHSLLYQWLGQLMIQVASSLFVINKTDHPLHGLDGGCEFGGKYCVCAGGSPYQGSGEYGGQVSK